jgi:hypothetical protein
MSDKRNNTINIKNKILAIPAAPAAMPPNPKMAAIIATIRNITVQRNITLNFWLNNFVSDSNRVSQLLSYIYPY